jgi:hypothetical protein
VFPPISVKPGGGASYVTLLEQSLVLDRDGNAVHVVGWSDEVTPVLIGTVPVPSPVAAYAMLESVYVASETDGYLKYDLATWMPLPFEFDMGDAGGCHDALLHGMWLVGGLRSPEMVRVGTAMALD